MKLVVLGDFHYSRMEDGTEEMQSARDSAFSFMLERFLELDADHHISLGDLTHEGDPEELNFVYTVIGGSERRFLHAIGNHDAYTLPKEQIETLTGQPRYLAIEREEATILVLDTSKEMNRSDWGGELDEAQLAWLEAELVRSGEKPVLVFAHHPVYGTTARSTLEKLSVDPRLEIEAVLKRKEGPGFYFCGHNHIHSIVRRDNWHFIQTAACLDVPAFRIVELKDGRLDVRMHRLEEAELAEHIARFHRNMPGFSPIAEANGEASDWELTVELPEIAGQRA